MIAGGCATPYQSKGMMGGFSETRLEPGVFRVTFDGNGFTSMLRAKDFTMLRAAELATQHGYSHFIISNNSATYTHTWINTYPNPDFIDGIVHPGTSIIIHCFNSPPETEKHTVFDAHVLLDSLRTKYNLHKDDESGNDVEP